MHKVLIADDESSVRSLLVELLESKFNVDEVARGDAIIKAISKTSYDILLLDIHLPGKNGLDVLKEIQEKNLTVKVVILTANSDVDTAISAMKYGAYDYLTKPFDNQKLLNTLNNISDRINLEREISSLRKEVERSFSLTGLLAESAPMIELIKTIKKVINTDSTILITGESGTGKGVLARTIHYNSIRKEKPFRSVDCSTIPGELIGSELFGHEKGSFTGAISKKIGKFEAAEDGTLFLDEISNVPFDMQAKLLTVIQDRVIERIGGNKLVNVNARIVAASNKDLLELVNSGEFREDLFYRLNVVPVKIPPLRDRKEDIPILIKYFLSKFNGLYEKTIELNESSLLFMQNYHWPGNVRQLENLIRRIVLLGNEKGVSLKDMEGFLQSESSSSNENIIEKKIISFEKQNPFLAKTGEFRSYFEIEKEVIENALKHFQFNITLAAKGLKLSRKTLHNKINKYGIIISKSIKDRG